MPDVVDKNPLDPNSDTDGDGFADSYETQHGSDPLNGDDPVQGGANDTDGDGIPNGIDPDDDNDGATDVQEAAYGTNPLVPDQDFMPITKEENGQKATIGYVQVIKGKDGKPDLNTSKPKSKVIVDASLPKRVKTIQDKNGKRQALIEVDVKQGTPGNCQDYKAYAKIMPDGHVETGYIGICDKAMQDPTAKGGNLTFVPGTQARILPTTAAEKAEHENAETVIVDDVIVPIDEPVIIGGKK